jgi:hypothetical protein
VAEQVGERLGHDEHVVREHREHLRGISCREAAHRTD